MQYVILIYDDESAVVESGSEAVEAILHEHGAFIEAHRDQVVSSHRLRPSFAATSVRRGAAGEAVVTDGVFAETKEMLGGFYFIEVHDLDEALALARDVPAPWGGVEVRPIWPPDE